jgi:hypothetical protein
MHEQYVKLHSKIKFQGPTKINKQTIKQTKLSPTRQVFSEVVILSWRADVEW